MRTSHIDLQGLNAEMTRTPDPISSPWWDSTRHADRRPLLLARNRIKAAIRRHFEAADFTETECAILQVSPGNETHLHAFSTEIIGLDRSRTTRYLHTSPEFAAKKLLAAGETRIFDFARVFRNREGGPLHVPEFTMLEWYRAETPYGVIMQDSIDILRLAAKVAGNGLVRFGEHVCDAVAAPETLSVADAFSRHAGIDLLATLRSDGTPDTSALRVQAEAVGMRTAADDDWTDLFSRVLSDRVEPRLGRDRPTLLVEYPVIEAALARPCPHDPRLAERFELYVCGVELANGFGELTDPVEQRRRFEADMVAKQRIYGERYPIDEAFLDAVACMPAASGVAVGFDRLVMLAVGARSVRDVLWTPPAEA